MPFTSYVSFCYVIMCPYLRTGSIASNSPMSASQSSNDGDADDERISVLLYAKMIQATWDIAPRPAGQATPPPFMHWKKESRSGCASLLIKRYISVFMSHLLFVVSAISPLFLQKLGDP